MSRLDALSTAAASSSSSQTLLAALKRYFASIAWREEARLWSTATLLAAVLMLVMWTVFSDETTSKLNKQIHRVFGLSGADIEQAICRAPLEFVLRKTWKWLPHAVQNEFRWFEEWAPDDEEMLREKDARSRRRVYVCGRPTPRRSCRKTKSSVGVDEVLLFTIGLREAM